MKEYECKATYEPLIHTWQEIGRIQSFIITIENIAVQTRHTPSSTSLIGL